jgi:hypothetical protein
MSDEDNIGKRIKDRLDNHEFPVSGNVWESIHKSLPTPTTGYIKTPDVNLLAKTSYSFSVFSYASVAVSLLSSLLLVTSIAIRTPAPSSSNPVAVKSQESVRVTHTDSTDLDVASSHISAQSAFAKDSTRKSDSVTRFTEQPTFSENTFSESTTIEPISPTITEEKPRTPASKESSSINSTLASKPVHGQLTDQVKQSKTPEVRTAQHPLAADQRIHTSSSTAIARKTTRQGNEKKDGSVKARQEIVSEKKSISTTPANALNPVTGKTTGDSRTTINSKETPIHTANTASENTKTYSDIQDLTPQPYRLPADTGATFYAASGKSWHPKAREGMPLPEDFQKKQMASIDSLPGHLAGKPGEGDKNNITIPRVSIRQRFSIDVLLQPRYTFGRSDVRGDQPTNEPIWNKTEKGAFHFAGSMLLNLALSKRFTISSGVSYESLGKVLHYNYATSVVVNRPVLIYGWIPSQGPGQDSVYVPIDTITHSNTVRKTVQVKETQRASYTGIPVAVTMHWSKNRWKGFVTLGGQVNLLQQTQHTAIHTDSLHSYQAPSLISTPEVAYRKVVPVVFVRAGAMYQVSEQFAIIMAPQFQYTLSPVYTKNYASNQHFYSVGIAVGLQVKLPTFPAIHAPKF